MNNFDIIDTHAHLYLSDFDNDVNKVIDKSLKSGISKIYMPCLSSLHYVNMIKLFQKYPNICKPMLGVHPLYVNNVSFIKELNFIKKHIYDNEFVAIGEIGLDFYKDNIYHDIQKYIFIFQVILAKKHNLPIIIHSRSSFNDIFNIFKQINIKYMNGIFHCFSGNLYQAKRIVDFGMKLGIGGLLIHNKNLTLTLKEIDITNIVLETDSPYLSPILTKRRKNKPYYLKYIIKKLSRIYNISYQDVCIATYNNAKEVFNK